MGRRQVEPTFIDFSEVGEQSRGGGAIPGHERGEITQQDLVGEMGKCVGVHGSSAHADGASGRGGDE